MSGFGIGSSVCPALIGPPGVKRIRPEVPRDRALIADDLAEAMARCCADGTGASWPLFIHGGAGVGKTCAALYLTDRVAGGGCLFRDYAELCADLSDAKYGRLVSRGSHGESHVTARAYWHHWSRARLAVADEIGTRDNVTDHGYETLKSAIDSRSCRPLVLISNLGLPQIAEMFDDRIASRIAGGTVVEVGGEDRRLEGVGAGLQGVTT